MSNKEKLPKVADMTGDQEVIQYDDDVSKLIADYNSKIKEAKDNTELSDIAFFGIGKKLIEVEQKIQSDNQEPKIAKKVFAAFKLRISEKISKNISNVDKVFKVAQFCKTDIYKKHQSRLPAGWGTLYLLLSLKDDKKELDENKVNQLMSDNEINSDIKRSELIKKIGAIKNPDKVTNEKVTITVEGGIKPTQEQLKELEKYLKRKFKQWTVTHPAITSEEPTDVSEDNKTE